MMVDLYMMHKLGVRLSPEIKLSKDLFKKDLFIDIIMNFYEKAKGRPIDKDFPLTKPIPIKPEAM